MFSSILVHAAPGTRARWRAPRRPPARRQSSPGSAEKPAPAGLTRAAPPPGVAPHPASTRAATLGAAPLTRQRDVDAQRADARTAAAAATGEERREACVGQPQAGRQPRGSVLGGGLAGSKRKSTVGERTRTAAAAADAALLALISATLGHRVVGMELSKHRVEILDRKATNLLLLADILQAIVDRDGHRLLVASSVLHRSFKLRKLRP